MIEVNEYVKTKDGYIFKILTKEQYQANCYTVERKEE